MRLKLYLNIDVVAFFAQMNVEKLMKMAGAVRTGGKGSMRRYEFCFSILLKYLLGIVLE